MTLPKDDRPSESDQSRKLPEVSVNAGILKEKERETIEAEIVEKLGGITKHLTRAEIGRLAERIKTADSIESLKNTLRQEERLEKSELSDEVVHDLFALIEEIRKVVKLSLDELRINIGKIDPEREFSVESAIYPSHHMEWVKRLEKSELGENIILDIAGITVGALDSVQAILKLLLLLITDIFLLPRDLMAMRDVSNKK